MADTILGRVKKAQASGGSYNVFTGATREASGEAPSEKLPKDWKIAKYVDEEGEIRVAYIRAKRTGLPAVLGGQVPEVVDEKGEPLPAEVRDRIDEWEAAQYEQNFPGSDRKIRNWIVRKREKGWQ
jgi:hypothetical protein